jgi:hypothetical protein
MMQATIAATVVEMADGRLALVVEMEPDSGAGPIVVDGTYKAPPTSTRAP